MHLFLSHNHRDKDVATPLAAQLRLVGVDVWLDDWKISPGDSIVGKVGEALGMVDTVLLLWSENAASSRWVNTEMEAALTRQLSGGSLRIIPVRLDDTELPQLLRPLKYIKAERGYIDHVSREVMGLGSAANFIKAVQQTIDEAALGSELRYFHGYGVAIGCPKCGADSSELEGWSAMDHEREDTYAGVRCKKCRWEDGGEVW